MRSRTLPLPALLLAALAVAPAQAAVDPACARYGPRGLLPGMTSREVAREMGGKGDETRVEAGSGRPVSSVTYAGWPSPVTVVYDGVVGKGEVVVLEVRMALPDRIDRAPRELLALLDRMGSPTSGKDHLDAGLTGPTAWADAACNVLVVARPGEENWWEASRPVSTLSVQPLDAACRRADPPDLPWDVLCAVRSPAAVAAAAPVRPAAVPAPPAEAAPASVTAAVPPSGQAAPAETEPQLIEAAYVPPRYPEAMRRIRVPALIRLELTVEVDGSVGDVRVVDADPPGRGFERAAIEAARRWRFRPGTRDGRPVRDNATVNVRFE